MAQEKAINGIKLGQLLGLSKSPLTDWKNGQSYPTTKQIIKLCEIFAVSADYILFGNEYHLSDDENNLIKNFHKLSNSDQQEILNIIEYKIYKAEEKETSSSSNAKPKNKLA